MASDAIVVVSATTKIRFCRRIMSAYVIIDTVANILPLY